MNFKELTEKIVNDSTNENPYLTTDDIQGIADEIKVKDDTIISLQEENEKIKKDYDTLKERIVSDIIDGRNKPTEIEPVKEEKEDTKSLQDLIKSEYKDFIK